MRAEAIRDALRAKPFRPQRLHVSDGSSYDVRNAELCMVGVHDLFLGFPSPDDPDLAFNRYVIIALTHVTRVEPVPQEAAPPSTPANGPG